jgi:hypothetical protein
LVDHDIIGVARWFGGCRRFRDDGLAWITKSYLPGKTDQERAEHHSGEQRADVREAGGTAEHGLLYIDFSKRRRRSGAITRSRFDSDVQNASSNSSAKYVGET